jgi:HEAT repeat protein
VTCARVLSRIASNDRLVVNQFLSLLIEDKNAVIRVAAVEGVRDMTVWTSDWYPRLKKGLDDPNHSVRLATAWALVEKEDPCKVVPVLIRAFCDKDDQEIEGIANALSSCKGDVFPRFKEAVMNEKGSIRAGAIRTLGHMASRDAVAGKRLQTTVNLAGDLLKDGDAQVRRSAIRALGLMVDEKSLSILPKVIEGIRDEDEDVRIGCCNVLGTIRSAKKECIQALEELLQDPSSTVRGQAAEALEQVGPAAKSAVGRLIFLLKNDVEIVRHKACETLGAIGKDAKDAIPALKEVLECKDEALRRVARKALERIEGTGER